MKNTGSPPRKARLIARDLVGLLEDRDDDRVFCRRLSIITRKRWTDAMVKRFAELARELRPDLIEGYTFSFDDVNTSNPYADAQRIEREYMEIVRPFVRLSKEGVLWVGSSNASDTNTAEALQRFRMKFYDRHTWVIPSAFEREAVEFAEHAGVAVTAGAAEHVFSTGKINPALIPGSSPKPVAVPSTPSLFDTTTITQPASELSETASDATNDSFFQEPGPSQGSLLATVNMLDETVDVEYDGKDLVVRGVVSEAVRERLKTVPLIGWDGREKQWFLAPNKAKPLIDLADMHGWSVEEAARQAVHDAYEQQVLVLQAQENARQRSRSLTPMGEITIPGLKENFVPRPYQEAGIELASELKRVILADDVGLGKTFQAAGTVAACNALPVIVVAKAGLKLNWHKELTDLFGWSTFVVEGRTTETIPEVDAVIVNPDLLKARLEDLKNVDPMALIVDESHFLANPRSQRSKALRALARPIRKKDGLVLSLTATLMPNGKAMEVYPQLDMLGFLGKNSPFAADWDSFGRKYAAGYKAYGRLVVDTPIDDPQRGEQVRKGLLKLNEDLETYCMIRRSKKDAQPDLPDAQISPVYLNVNEKLWSKYQQAEIELAEFLAERAAEIARELGQNPYSAAVKARMRLEFSGHEKLQAHNALAQLSVAAKFAEMIDWIDTFLTDNPDEKLLVFAHHRAVQAALAGLPIPTHNENSIQIVDWEKQLGTHLDHAKNVAERFQAGTILANADQKVADVEKDKDRFQNDPDCRLMVLSLGAGSEGHTLTAAWHIAFAQLPMTAKAFRQAVGRAHGRLNDPHPVWVHPLLAGESGTIDHDTLKRINRKGAALDAVQDGIVTDINEETDSINEDSADSLLDIFERYRNNS